jgi:hypothetical protein
VVFRSPAAMLFALLLPHACTNPAAEPTEAELTQLVARARPAWENYGEDMKAALGATPVARWSGRPVLARLDRSKVYVEFELSPPWNEYVFGMPVLLRDPLGRVHRPASYEDNTYTYSLAGFAPGAVIAWVELRFPPNEERRIAFDREGVWRAENGR